VALMGCEEPVLLTHGDRLVMDSLEEGRASCLEDGAPVLYQAVSTDSGDGEGEGEQVLDDGSWTGWAWLSPETARGLDSELDFAGLEQQLRGAEAALPILAPHVLAANSVRALKEAHRQVMDGHVEGLLLTGREVEAGIFMSRNVVLHPTARILAPVYIGENVRIGRGARIGPHAVVSSDCIVESRCIVEDALVLPGSYVGEGLELTDVCVDRNLLINIEHDAVLTITDRFILGSMKQDAFGRWLRDVVSRLLAGGVLLLAWPLLLLTMLALTVLRRGPLWHQREALQLPTVADELHWKTTELSALASFQPRVAQTNWRDFLLRVLPLLPQVLRGRIALVGVPPYTPDEVRAFPIDRRAVLLKSKVGLIWEAHASGAWREDEWYSAEIYYAVVASARHDAGLVLRYLVRLALFGFGDGSKARQRGARRPRTGALR
jgi:hypothetical protein